jgi:hypothetical protein
MALLKDRVTEFAGPRKTRSLPSISNAAMAPTASVLLN